jgi:3-phosphoshikimate 1-carboxyvinyltransferase
MREFFFHGEIPASKSLMNRALVIQSFFPSLKIDGDSQCADVKDMKLALKSMRAGKDIFCGDAGTVFRFLAFHCSRMNGKHRLVGSPRLLSRPHDDLEMILSKLGVKVSFNQSGIEIQSEGWKDSGKTLMISRAVSSQFASGLLLNAWNLDFDLDFEMEAGISEGYWRMTVQMVRQMGMTVLTDGWRWKVPKGQTAIATELTVEPDYSSSFAIAAAGSLSGMAQIKNFSEESLQPDVHGFHLLKIMNATVEIDKNTVQVKKSAGLVPIDVSLENCPDLFPVLAIVCAFADGVSILRGAPHLIHKESNRILKTKELLSLAGFETETMTDGLKIFGQGQKFKPNKFTFDPDHDHRMAMSAGLLMLMGYDIRLLNPEVVFKSFPEFWQILGVKL